MWGESLLHHFGAMAEPTVYLFDIDGTLLVTGGAGRRAMRRAFDEIVGFADALEGIHLGGMTDRLILRHGLQVVGREFEEEVVVALLDRYLTYLEEELPRSAGYRVMPGVQAAVDLCLQQPVAAVGLGTGNVERGARAKLRRAQLDGHFRFGGFGCDAEDRVELLRIGAERGARALGVPLAEARLVIIGDTPRDVAAAAALDAECIAVTTGAFSAEELREAGAEHVFASLKAPGVRDRLERIS